MKPITRFTQPDVLYDVGTELLMEFFDHFKPELDAKGIVLPDPSLADGHYYESIVELMKKPEGLPDGMVEAILAIEALASPENKQRLEFAFWDSPKELYIEPQVSPEHTAMKLWLNSPYGISEPAPAAESAQEPPQRSSVQPETIREPAPAPALPKSEPPKRPILSPPVKSPSGHTRQGKVARLPLEVREKLNFLLLDGAAYSKAIKALGEEGAGLTEDHITSWKQGGGYKDWLTEQQDREDMHLSEEYTMQLVKENDGTTLNEATIKMATGQIRQALRASGQIVLKTALEDNSDNYMRLLNALARLTTGAIHCQHHRVRDEERKANLEKANADPGSLSITPETLRKIEELLRIR